MSTEPSDGLTLEDGDSTFQPLAQLETVGVSGCSSLLRGGAAHPWRIRRHLQYTGDLLSGVLTSSERNSDDVVPLDRGIPV